MCRSKLHIAQVLTIALLIGGAAPGSAAAHQEWADGGSAAPAEPARSAAVTDARNSSQAPVVSEFALSATSGPALEAPTVRLRLDHPDAAITVGLLITGVDLAYSRHLSLGRRPTGQLVSYRIPDSVMTTLPVGRFEVRLTVTHSQGGRALAAVPDAAYEVLRPRPDSMAPED